MDEHLYRREHGRMIAALTRVFGAHNLGLVEDVVQEAFCRALETWAAQGPPPNPQAWLMTTAKNCALDALRRQRTAATFAPQVDILLRSEWTLVPQLEELLSPGAVQDDQLRMMFCCCDPRLPEIAQVMLILNLLCGLGIAEVASAFLSSYAATEKRLVRAKKTLADGPGLADVSDARELAARLPGVQRALYLLFNEGYHGASSRNAVRTDLCREALYLTAQLLQDPRTAAPSTHALAALMSFHAARLPARLDEAGNLLPLSQQDRSLWDAERMAEGLMLLQLAAQGPLLSEYHLEAAIASLHASAGSTADTDWPGIVQLYDQLLALRPSPVIALNRAIAVAQSSGAESGLAAMAAIQHIDCLADYPFRWAALGELELQCGRPAIAMTHFRAAQKLARNDAERQFLKARQEQCRDGAACGRIDTYGETVSGP